MTQAALGISRMKMEFSFKTEKSDKSAKEGLALKLVLFQRIQKFVLFELFYKCYKKPFVVSCSFLYFVNNNEFRGCSSTRCQGRQK